MRRNNSPRSLYPAREQEDVLKLFVMRYGGALFCLAIALALILFVGIVMATVPPTESGTFYNHLN